MLDNIAHRSRPFCRGFAVALFCGGFLLCGPNLVPAQGIRFTDVTPSAAIGTAGPTQGVAVADVNGDGFDDVFFASAVGSSALFLNDGNGSFSDRTVESGLETPGNAVAPVWVDVNNDGALDLFVGIRSGDEPNRLYLNDGTGVFQDVIETSGIDPTARIGSAAFGDFDLDGYPDLFLATRGDHDRLYRNIDGATFEDMTVEAGVQGEFGSVAMQSMWVDYDRDGDSDLFAVHDGVTVNRLYRNDGALPFSEVASALGIDQVGSGNGMGVAWFDSDLDGRDDVYVTRIGTGSLYRSQTDGTFNDVASEVGAQENGMSWGVVAADFDNDGDDDLFIVNTFSFDNSSETFLYRNDGGTFSNVAQAAGAAMKLDAFGVAAGDFNADGAIDLITTSTMGDNRLLINTTEQLGNWVEVELKRGEAQQTALGAAIRIVAGGQTQYKSLYAGQGYCSQNAGRLHFGLGQSTQVDTLEIVWPGGGAEIYEGVAGNKRYVLTEGSRTVSNTLDGPEEMDLVMGPAFPNPFNRALRIEFSLAYDSEAHVDVLDLLGRRVAVLASGFMSKGIHVVDWSGRIDQGGQAPVGAYVVRLRTDGRQRTRIIFRGN